MTREAWKKLERKISIELTEAEAVEIDKLVATAQFGSTREALARHLMVQGLVAHLKRTSAELPGVKGKPPQPERPLNGEPDRPL